MTKRFFVYGAMSEGLVHWSKISQFIESTSPARLRAAVFRLKVGFPVLLKEGRDLVEGCVAELKSSDFLLGLLDEFHGFCRFDSDQSLFVREEAELENGEKCWVYFLNPKKLPSSAKAIHGGDWKKTLESEPPLTAKMTERQRCYLFKLAAVTGREIVPINDLSLYRELMNLGLIVDKGRRLALSELGHEVVRYLE